MLGRTLLISTLSLSLVSSVASRTEAACPIGYNVTHLKSSKTMCYAVKGPERFDQMYDQCSENEYKPITGLEDGDFWSTYRNLYPDGPLLDCPEDEASCGEFLPNTANLVYPKNVNGLLCTVVNADTRNRTAVACSEKKLRYCSVMSYKKLDNADCQPGYFKVEGPVPSCLQVVKKLRVTWNQANAKCMQQNGTLVQRGWRYANHPEFNISTPIPLGVVMNNISEPNWVDYTDQYINADASPPTGAVPIGDIRFSPDEAYPVADTQVALDGQYWKLVNKSTVFTNILCEHPVKSPSLQLQLYNDDKNTLRLSANVYIRDQEIACYTDSNDFPKFSRVKITDRKRNESSTNYRVDTDRDGYYWCSALAMTSYPPPSTKKVLHIGKEQEQLYKYAVKLKLGKKYDVQTLNQLSENIRRNFSVYLYTYNKLVQTYGTPAVVNETRLEEMAKESEESSLEEVVDGWRLRRSYLDSRTLLYHARISRVTFPLPTSVWRGMEIQYMRPVYYCPVQKGVDIGKLGTETILPNCRLYRCVGDYNEGVQWIESTADHCSTTSQFTEQVQSLQTTVYVPSTTDAPDYTAIFKSVAVITPTAVISDTVSSDFTNPPAATTTRKPWPPTTSTAASESPTTVEMVTTASTPPPPTTPSPKPPPTTRPPEQVIQEVLQALEDLLQEPNVTITVEQTQQAVDQMDNMLTVAGDADIPGRLLHLIDEVGVRLDLNGSQSETVVRENIGLLVADSVPGAPVRGLRLMYSGTDSLSEETFHLITGEVNEDYMDQNSSEVVVKLPESLVDAEKRVTFVVFRNSNAFNSQNGQLPVNSRVLSINITDLSSFDDGDYVDIHLRPLDPEVPRDARRACAYWHFNEDDTGYWSQEGCTFIPSERDTDLDVCRCTHLTHFAEILAPRTVFSERDESALEVISIIGCCISIAGLLMIALTAILFRSWRRDFSNKVWLQLSASIALLVASFLIVAFARFESFTPLCLASGVMLHYATLSSFCWMLVAAVLSYRRLVLVFARDASHKLLRAGAFAWGTPAAIIGILLAVNPAAYSDRFSEVEHTTASFCYPTGAGLWVAVFTPIAAALVINWVLFILIVYSVFGSRRVKRHGDTGEALRCITVSSLLVFLFGLPWIFGLFSYLVAFAYLFALSATYQGFILFVFFIVGNKKTRDMWLNKLKIKQIQKVPVTSSTYRSRGWRGRDVGSGGVASGSSSGTAAMEEANAKPRSLTSTDESRFS